MERMHRGEEIHNEIRILIIINITLRGKIDYEKQKFYSEKFRPRYVILILL